MAETEAVTEYQLDIEKIHCINLTSEAVSVSKNPAKQIGQIIKSMMEYP